MGSPNFPCTDSLFASTRFQFSICKFLMCSLILSRKYKLKKSNSSKVQRSRFVTSTLNKSIYFKLIISTGRKSEDRAGRNLGNEGRKFFLSIYKSYIYSLYKIEMN